MKLIKKGCFDTELEIQPSCFILRRDKTKAAAHDESGRQVEFNDGIPKQQSQPTTIAQLTNAEHKASVSFLHPRKKDKLR